MRSALQLLVLSGSARRGSLNRQLAGVATRAGRAQGAVVIELDLRALALPVYDGDLEADAGVPAGARTLRDALLASDALLLVTPEYNGFPPPLVINAFDWLSRLGAEGDTPSGLAATANKPAAVMSASPGALGGLRALNFTRQYLQMAFAMLVAPQQHALGRAHEAFDPEGQPRDPKLAASVDGVVAAVLTLAGAVKG